eukprot:GHVU01157982.1.p2 GENE.GHVU01157982.1~~GHVU01157982.1.p2  ORF type:complete len:292 (+),score=30.73 GHVU01157982.1:1911-2786(+)
MLAFRPEAMVCKRLRMAATSVGFPEWTMDTEHKAFYGQVSGWISRHKAGLRKVEGFKELLSRSHRDSRFVWVGDTGEYDPYVGKQMTSICPDRMAAVFLHDVLPLRHQDWHNCGVPVLHFRTYVGAASKALLHGLIPKEGLLRVMKAALTELMTIETRQGKPYNSRNGPRLLRDCDAAEGLLRGSGLEETNLYSRYLEAKRQHVKRLKGVHHHRRSRRGSQSHSPPKAASHSNRSTPTAAEGEDGLPSGNWGARARVNSGDQEGSSSPESRLAASKIPRGRSESNIYSLSD